MLAALERDFLSLTDETVGTFIVNLSIITPCKNRLEHLKQTLPILRTLKDVEIIVVDYGCEQGTGDWVAENYSDVRVVRVLDDPIFHVSRARNSGALAAKADVLCFVDADTFIVGDLSQWLPKHLEKNCFYTIPEPGASTAGFMICHKSDFLNVGGYDEALRGWGPEDMDLYERLEIAGVAKRPVPAHMFDTIHHGDELRQFGAELGAFQDRETSRALGAFYRVVKRDIRNLVSKEPDLEFRKQLLEQIKQLDQTARQQGNSSFSLTVNMGSRKLGHSESTCLTAMEYRYEGSPGPSGE